MGVVGVVGVDGVVGALVLLSDEPPPQLVSNNRLANNAEIFTLFRDRKVFIFGGPAKLNISSLNQLLPFVIELTSFITLNFVHYIS